LSFPDVAATRIRDEPLESIQNPTLDRRIEALQITPRWRRNLQ